MLALMQGDTPQTATGNHTSPQGTPSDISDAIFARRLREVREAIGLTQQQLADPMASTGNKIHRSTIGKIENGDRPVTVGEAVQIAGILDVDLADLLTEPATDLDVQEARMALEAAERQLRHLRYESDKASEVAAVAQFRVAEAQGARDAAEQRLGSLRRRKEQSLGLAGQRVPPLDPYAVTGSTDPYAVPAAADPEEVTR